MSQNNSIALQYLKNSSNSKETENTDATAVRSRSGSDCESVSSSSSSDSSSSTSSVYVSKKVATSGSESANKKTYKDALLSGSSGK